MFFTNRVAMWTGVILCGLTFAIMQSWTLAGPKAANHARFEFTGDKKEKKKVELPKLPGGAKPMWDLAAVEEKFIIHKGGLNDMGMVYFLIELKEDAANLGLGFKVNLIDSDGVKYASTTTFFDPNQGKKEDKVRLFLNGLTPKFNQAIWAKAVKVQYVDR